MQRTQWMSVLAGLALVLATVACGDDKPDPIDFDFPDIVGTGDGDVADVDEPDDAGDTGDTGDTAGTGDEDVSTGDDTGEDTASDPDVVEPPPADLAELCDEYCAKLVECGQPFGGTDACPAACLENLEKDDGWVNSYVCAVIASCNQVSGCTAGPIPTAEPCAEMCAIAQECGLFPSSALGADDEQSCVASCSIQIMFNPVGFGPRLDCIAGAIGGCSEADVFGCNETLGAVLCEQICEGGVIEGEGEGPEQTCGKVPEPYESEEACLSDCDGWKASQRWTLRFCVSQFKCEGDTSVCFPPPEGLVPGSAETCAAAWDLCGESEDWNLPQDPEICAWILGGIAIAQGLTFDNAVECIEAYETCPEGNNLFGCLVEPYPPCEAYCTKLLGCGVPATIEQCNTQCSMSYQIAPEATDASIDCVANVGSCAEISGCFPDEEEPQE